MKSTNFKPGLFKERYVNLVLAQGNIFYITKYSA